MREAGGSAEQTPEAGQGAALAVRAGHRRAEEGTLPAAAITGAAVLVQVSDWVWERE